MTEKYYEMLDKFVPVALDKVGLGDRKFSVISYDLDRIILLVDKEIHTYCIRMWNLTKSYIHYTVYEDFPGKHCKKSILDNPYFVIPWDNYRFPWPRKKIMLRRSMSHILPGFREKVFIFP